MRTTALLSALLSCLFALTTSACADSEQSDPGPIALADTAADTIGGGEIAVLPDHGTPPPTDLGVQGDEGGWPDEVSTAEPIAWIPCTENADCETGWCVETADGRTCTRTCIDSCPEGWYCGAVQNTGTDVTYICLPRFVNLCKPCQTDTDCGDTTEAGTASCVSYGPSGSFCGADCSLEDCPAGYLCQEAQCVLEAGECECTWKAVKDAATTHCEAVNELGGCQGTRSCLDGKLSACDAQTPSAEVCDGVDNDCNGAADDGIPSGVCTESSDFGTCTGALVCTDGGVEVCTAQVPEVEKCDGKDNDCNGDIDEGFPDSDEDGVADCMSQDDDGDGVLDWGDNCPTVGNPDQDDMDSDGVGDVCDSDIDGDGDPNDTDCAPEDAGIGHKATEECNGIDDDCDASIDEGFADLDDNGVADCVDDDDDGDGVVDAEDNCPVTANSNQKDSDGDGIGDLCEDDLDGDGDPDLTDCEPLDDEVHHGQTEACNGDDDNCNGFIDEGFGDTDGDGVADCLDTDDDGDGVIDPEDNCPLTANADQMNTDEDAQGDACDSDDDGDGDPDALDCAPLDPAVNHKVVEACNGKDDDCDQVIDEGGAVGCVDYLWDSDGDGFGVEGLSSCLCKAAAPYTATAAGDCDDKNGQVFPGAAEVCNGGTDDNCDGQADAPGSAGCIVLFVDADLDGWGAGEICVCTLGVGYSTVSGDCDDKSPSVNPAAQEICGDELDNDCSGEQDEPNAKGCVERYFDSDGDDFGVSGQVQCLCAPSGKYSAPQGGDCKDNDDEVFPTNPESCDGKDNNCNGQIDEGVQTTFYKDNDGDGYGGTTLKDACSKPTSYADESGDCNDYNEKINPGAEEACNDLDDDCDGGIDEEIETKTIYKDNDGDGFAAKGGLSQDKCNVPVGWTLAKDVEGDGTPDWDCDDSNVTAHPAAAELCDGKDNNCDGYVDSSCPGPCPGTWPVTMSLPSHMPARLADLNGDSLEELYILDAAGNLRQISMGGVASTICPNLKFHIGYDSKFGWTVNPALGSWKYYFVQGTRIFDLDSCQEVVPHPSDVAGFGSVGDLDGDHVLDYAGHYAVNTKVCFKLSSKSFGTECVTSPNGKPYDGYLASFDVDADGRSEMVTVRGRTYPGTEPNDGHLDIFGFDGAAMVLESSIEPSVTGAIGTHISGVDIADFDGDGFSKVQSLFGGTIVDLGAGVKTGALVGDAIPIPRTFDLDGDGKLDAVVRGVLVDLDHDGVPESLRGSGNELTVIKNDGKNTVMDGWPVSLGTFTWSVDAVAGDVNNDGRLDVFMPSIDGAIYCHRLGAGSASFTNIVGRGEPEWVNRTMVTDVYEPNDTKEAAWPLRFPTKEIRGRLTKGDEDWYRLVGTGGLFVHLHSPQGLDFDVYWYNDTGEKLYASSTKGAGVVDSVVKCVACTEPAPPSYLLKIVPKNPEKDYSASRPYVLKVSKIP